MEGKKKRQAHFLNHDQTIHNTIWKKKGLQQKLHTTNVSTKMVSIQQKQRTHTKREDFGSNGL